MRGLPPDAFEASKMEHAQIMKGFVKRARHQVYDTIQIDRQSASLNDGYLRFFSYQIGSLDPQGRMKDLTRTNMRRGNQFPPPECLILDRISMRFSAETDIITKAMVAENIIWNFQIDEKIYVRTAIAMMQESRCTAEALIFECTFCGRLRVNSPECLGCGSGQTKIIANAPNWLEMDTEIEYFYDLAPFSKYIAPLQHFGIYGTLPSTGLTLPGDLKLRCFLTGVHDERW